MILDFKAKSKMAVDVKQELDVLKEKLGDTIDTINCDQQKKIFVCVLGRVGISKAMQYEIRISVIGIHMISVSLDNEQAKCAYILTSAQPFYIANAGKRSWFKGEKFDFVNSNEYLIRFISRSDDIETLNVDEVNRIAKEINQEYLYENRGVFAGERFGF